MNRRQARHYGNVTGFTYYSICYNNSGSDTVFVVEGTYQSQPEAIATRDLIWNGRFNSDTYQSCVAMWVDRIECRTVGGVKL